MKLIPHFFAVQLVTFILAPTFQTCVYVFVCLCVCLYKQEMLQSVTWESTELSNDITKRKQMLAKIEEEIQHAEEVCYQSKNVLDFALKLFRTD